MRWTHINLQGVSITVKMSCGLVSEATAPPSVHILTHSCKLSTAMKNGLVNSRFGIQLDKVLRHLIPNMCNVHTHTHGFLEAKLLQPAGSVACTKQPSLSLLYKHYLLIITHMNICMFESSQLCAAFQVTMTMCYSYCISLTEGIKTPEKEQQGWFMMQNLVREAKLWPKRSCFAIV